MPNVVIPTGIVPMSDGSLLVAYGAADAYVGLARLHPTGA
ncbi:hypothetical protein HJC99_03965 [Candidatus Saccharibacteria bacterium]|nr:hypothetical protein [Candidatus Saccharibacteria bacterium]